MSNRSMLEFNHDFIPYGEAEIAEFAKAIRRYLGSGDPALLPYGVTWFGMRHHSEKCQMGEPPRGWDNQKPRARG